MGDVLDLNLISDENVFLMTLKKFNFSIESCKSNTVDARIY